MKKVEINTRWTWTIVALLVLLSAVNCSLPQEVESQAQVLSLLNSLDVDVAPGKPAELTVPIVRAAHYLIHVQPIRMQSEKALFHVEAKRKVDLYLSLGGERHRLAPSDNTLEVELKPGSHAIVLSLADAGEPLRLDVKLEFIEALEGSPGTDAETALPLSLGKPVHWLLTEGEALWCSVTLERAGTFAPHVSLVEWNGMRTGPPSTELMIYAADSLDLDEEPLWRGVPRDWTELDLDRGTYHLLLTSDADLRCRFGLTAVRTHDTRLGETRESAFRLLCPFGSDRPVRRQRLLPGQLTWFRLEIVRRGIYTARLWFEDDKAPVVVEVLVPTAPDGKPIHPKSSNPKNFTHGYELRRGAYFLTVRNPRKNAATATFEIEMRKFLPGSVGAHLDTAIPLSPGESVRWVFSHVLAPRKDWTFFWARVQIEKAGTYTFEIRSRHSNDDKFNAVLINSNGKQRYNLSDGPWNVNLKPGVYHLRLAESSPGACFCGSPLPFLVSLAAKD